MPLAKESRAPWVLGDVPAQGGCGAWLLPTPGTEPVPKPALGREGQRDGFNLNALSSSSPDTQSCFSQFNLFLRDLQGPFPWQEGAGEHHGPARLGTATSRRHKGATARTSISQGIAPTWLLRPLGPPLPAWVTAEGSHLSPGSG